MPKNRWSLGIASLTLVALLAACGGGDGGGPPADTTPPTIVSVTPSDGTGDVARSSAVTITFSEPIDVATVTPATVTFAGAAAVAYDATFAANTLTLTPSLPPLANFTPHTVVVTTGVTDAAGNHLAAAYTFDFTTEDDVAPSMPGDPTAPPAFVGLTAFTAGPVAFSWDEAIDDGSGVASYHLQIATATDGTGLLFDADVGNVLSHDLAVDDGETVYARVFAVDASGNPGPWSNWSMAYVVDASPPTIADAPADRGGFDTAEVDFTWDAGDDGAGSGVEYWVVEVSTVQGTAGRVLLADSLDPRVLFMADGYPDGTTFYARAAPVDRVGNAGDYSPWSDGVTLDTTGPSAPTAPSDAGDWDDASVTFGWSATSDAGSGVASYYLEVQGGGFGDDVGDVTSYDFDASGLTSGDQISARVRAVDALGNVGEFSPWSDGIRVDLVAPTVASAPDDGGANAYYLDPVHFDWPDAVEADSGLAGYTIVIETDAGTPVETVSTTSSNYSYTWTGFLPVTLVAQVRATDLVGNVGAFTAWSDGIEIRDDVPGAPGTPRDGGDYTSSTSITFDWDEPSTGAPHHYFLEVRTGENALVFEGPVYDVLETVDVSGWANGTTFFARVAAVNDLDVQGAFSGWSDGIMLDGTAPSAPTPQDRGDFDDRYVTFDWSAHPGEDPESGIVSYEIEVSDSEGSYTWTFVTTETSYDFDAESRSGWTFVARVRAQNAAGLWSDWSADTDGVTVDTMAPSVVEVQPSSNQLGVATNVDLRLRFSEPMDRASVEEAFSLAWAGGSPMHGYVFVWNVEGTEATVIPDTAHPMGATNVDLLPAETLFTLALGEGATDLAGNPITTEVLQTFTTADETAPTLVSLTVGGNPSPFDPADVQGSFVAVATFDEDMSTERARVWFDANDRGAEGGYQGIGLSWATGNGSTVTYQVGCGTGIQPGDRVTIRGTSPSSFDVTAAPVTAADFCTFTVPNPTGDTFNGGGWVSYPTGDGVRPNWVDLRTLEIRFADWIRLPAGSEARLEMSDLSDVGGNWTWLERELQVANDPDVDDVRPFLVASLPRDGDTGVPAMRPVVLKFSEPLDQSSASSVTADPDLYEIEYDTEAFGATIVLMPRRSPGAGEVVTVSVPGNVRDLAGNQLAAAFSVSFTVGDEADTGAPALAETIPPNGEPADEIWRPEAGFRDGLTGELDPIDGTSLGMEDVAVTNVGTGLLVRGFRPQVDPATAFVELVPPPHGPGLSRGWSGVAVVSALAFGGVATYQTAAPHGLPVGARVRVTYPMTPSLDLYDAEIVAVTETSFTVLSEVSISSTGSGWADYAVPASYLVELAVGAGRGGTGVLDAFGNAMPETGFTAYIAPWGNRVPVASSLRDLRLLASSSPAGRALRAEGGVRDPDRQVVHVTVASGTVLLEQDVDTSNQWGFQAGGDGPPQGTDPSGMAGLVPGPLDLTITLDDGTAQTSYTRRIWLWDETESPAIEGIRDGATFRAASARPIVVESTSTPTFEWTGVDQANADLLAAYLVSAAAVGSDGPPSGVYFETVPVPPQAASLAAPRPLDVDLYLWTIVQMRMARGTNEFAAQSWALDFNDPLGAMFVYGPANRDLAGDPFAGARMRVASDGSAVHGATGSYGFETPGGAEAPLFVDVSLADNEGGTVAGQEMFAADATTGAFMLTESAAGMPLPGKGGRSGNGRLFAVAHSDPSAPTLTAGAHRYQTSGFGTELTGSWIYAQAEATAGTGGLDWIGGSVGSVTPSATTLSVVGTQIDGVDFSEPAVPYTLGDDGRFEIQIGGGGTALGWVGGGASPGRIAVLASQNTPGRVFWLLTAEEADWSGIVDETDLSGAYRIADMSFALDPSAGSVGASGDAFFFGDGTFSYEVDTSFGPMTGGGSYAVDPMTRRVTLDFVTPDGTTQILLVAGAGFDTLFGVSVSSADRAEMLILTR